MHNPSGKEKGAILIKSEENDCVDFGTKISFMFKEEEDNNSTSYMYNNIYHYNAYSYLNGEHKYSLSALTTFDFAKTKKPNLLVMKILDEVAQFAKGSFVPVRLMYNDKEQICTSKPEIYFHDIDEETGLQLYIDNQYNIDDLTISRIYYRNQLIRNGGINLPFLGFHVNILKGDAKDILTLNRNEIRQEFQSKLENSIIKSSVKFLNLNFESLTIIQKQLASMYLIHFSTYDEDPREHNDWQDYNISLYRKKDKTSIELPIKQLLDANIVKYNSNNPYNHFLQFEYKDAKYRLEWDYPVTDILIFIMRQLHLTHHLSLTKDGYILYKGDRKDLFNNSNDVKEKIMFDYSQASSLARFIMPCSDKYKALSIEKGVFKEYQPYTLYGYLDYTYMICPYIRKYNDKNSLIGLEYDVDDAVIDLVYENKQNTSITRDEIKKAYSDFQQEWDTIIKKINKKINKKQ